MGRKRKSRTPVKISRSPPKGAKSDKSFDRCSEPSKVHDEEEHEVKPQLDVATTSCTASKQWEDKCRKWIIEQEQIAEPPPPEPDIGDEEVVEEPIQPPLESELPLRKILKEYSETEILNSVMYECEWLKCGFETIADLEYLNHVDAHINQYLAGQEKNNAELTCYWDLCVFKTTSQRDFESHLHFHAYHTRIKTYGASLSSIIRLPKCNSDSRRRNCIDQFKMQFTCEWNNCNEQYTKAYPFFAHVNGHVQDQFPVDKKSTKDCLQCQWEGCKQTYKRCSIALEHVRRHSTERTIGCYTCGAMFSARLKYIDHCKRQAEYHHREYPCPECDKLFATKQIMLDHMNIHKRKYACTLCPMKWPSKKALACHIRYRHVEERPYQCQICNHRTVTKADLDEHVITHDSRRMFRCEEFGCDAMFKCQKSLKKHVDSCHYNANQGIYACHICVNQFKTGPALSKHLIKAHKFQRPPGYNRFIYRPDRHGIYQLVLNGTSEDSQSSSSENLLIPIKPKAKRLKRSNSKESDEPRTPPKIIIDRLEPVAANSFSIALKLEDRAPIPSEQQQSTSPITTARDFPNSMIKLEFEDEPCTSTRSIDDFTVMKRYLKVEKPVVISFEETDSAGSVIRSETVQTTVLSPDNLLNNE